MLKIFNSIPVFKVRKKRRLDDNDNVDGDQAVKTTNVNSRKQPRAWVSGKRKLNKHNNSNITDGRTVDMKFTKVNGIFKLNIVKFLGHKQ